jgi:probable F420-dependent oxidoreductase
MQSAGYPAHKGASRETTGQYDHHWAGRGSCGLGSFAWIGQDPDVTTPGSRAADVPATQRLGAVGVWLNLGVVAAAQGRWAATELEQLGYGALWLNETPSNKEPLTLSALTLAGTEKLVVATGIANIWARDATAMAHAEATLGEAFPGRFVLGLGVSHAPLVGARGHDYSKPVTRMAEYLDTMDAAPYDAPPARPAVPRVLAALRPRMLELARDRTNGAHPYLVTPQHTQRARAILGPGKLLAPMQLVLIESDPDRARTIARSRFHFHLEAQNYTRSLLFQGFTEDDLANGGSDRLIDAIVAWGTSRLSQPGFANITRRARTTWPSNPSPVSSRSRSPP